MTVLQLVICFLMFTNHSLYPMNKLLILITLLLHRHIFFLIASHQPTIHHTHIHLILLPNQIIKDTCIHIRKINEP